MRLGYRNTENQAADIIEKKKKTNKEGTILEVAENYGMLEASEAS